MLKAVKRLSLSALESAGVFALTRESKWRRRRLLVLCYHGIARDDEHLWRPALRMERSIFASRMNELADGGYTVLQLSEALTRLYNETLPPRSVALTFDDGELGFYREAYPVLKSLGFPVTVYLTTYYCHHQFPVFHNICSYLLWKSRHKTSVAIDVMGCSLVLDLRTDRSREEATTAISQYAERKGMSVVEKNRFAEQLAAALDQDYADLLARRMLQLMNPSEVSELAQAGVDFQLHTHRHRSPLDESLYKQEIRDNRIALERMVDIKPRHFCYPSGVYRAEFEPWLTDEDVVSATTCEPGLASIHSRPLSIPRLVDVSSLSAIEFRGWLTGVSALLPRRKLPTPE